jgi:hypothetical protein
MVWLCIHNQQPAASSQQSSSQQQPAFCLLVCLFVCCHLGAEKNKRLSFSACLRASNVRHGLLPFRLQCQFIEESSFLGFFFDTFPFMICDLLTCKV